VIFSHSVSETTWSGEEFVTVKFGYVQVTLIQDPERIATTLSYWLVPSVTSSVVSVTLEDKAFPFIVVVLSTLSHNAVAV